MFFLGADAYNRELQKIGNDNRKAYIDFLVGYTFIIPVFVLPYVIAAFFFEVADFPS